MIDSLVPRISSGLRTEENNSLYKKTLHSNHLTEKRKLWKYLGGILSIIVDEADIKNRTKQ